MPDVHVHDDTVRRQTKIKTTSPLPFVLDHLTIASTTSDEHAEAPIAVFVTRRTHDPEFDRDIAVTLSLDEAKAVREALDTHIARFEEPRRPAMSTAILEREPDPAPDDLTDEEITRS